MIYKLQFRCMLVVALGWSLLEAILKSKTEHVMGKTATEDPQSTKHSSKCTFTPFGGGGAQYQSWRQMIWAVISVLEGQHPLEWQCQTKRLVFWKISETHLEDSKCTPLRDVRESSEKEEDAFPLTGRGCEGSPCHTPAESQPGLTGFDVRGKYDADVFC